MPGSKENGGWEKWSKWVVTALKKVIRAGEDLAKEVKGIREDFAPRLATLEERCSSEKMESLTEQVQENQISLAKLGAVGLLGGGVGAALIKLAEVVATTAQAGGPP